MTEMEQKVKPPLVASIREAECIGCMKCVQACPVDAILGSPKQMHTVIGDECTGCELCVAPCPVDCIDMLSAVTEPNRPDHYRARFQAHTARLQRDKTAQTSTRKQENSTLKRKSYIADAIARAKAKKSV
jgi:electron transport complex protein RnfB